MVATVKEEGEDDEDEDDDDDEDEDEDDADASDDARLVWVSRISRQPRS